MMLSNIVRWRRRSVSIVSSAVADMASFNDETAASVSMGTGGEGGGSSGVTDGRPSVVIQGVPGGGVNSAGGGMVGVRLT